MDQPYPTTLTCKVIRDNTAYWRANNVSLDQPFSFTVFTNWYYTRLENDTTVLVLGKLKKINTNAPEPQRNVLNYFAIFKNIAHSLEPGETPSDSAYHQAPKYAQRS